MRRERRDGKRGRAKGGEGKGAWGRGEAVGGGGEPFRGASMPLSLWLVPPESDSDEIASTMRAVASAHLLPSSAPHVTLLGDASGGGNDERALHEAVQRLISLGERWTGGAVVCEFTEIYGSDVWNQSGVAIMRETRQLLELQ